MIEVTEPQVWVLIAVFSAAIFAMLGIVTTTFNRTLTSAIGGLRDRMDARFEAMDSKFEAMDSKFEAMDSKFEAKFEAMDSRFTSIDARFAAMDATFDAKFEGMRAEVNGKFDLIEVKLEHMDADIQAISRHVFGTDPR
ncbi:hypothetical protein [Okibacterium endophyticum]